MKENEIIKKVITTALADIAPRKVILEVLDELLYLNIGQYNSRIKEAKGLNNFFKNELKATYRTGEKFFVSFYFGEKLLLEIVNAGLCTGIVATVGHGSSRFANDLLADAIKIVMPEGFHFYEQMNDTQALEYVSRFITRLYKRMLAPHIIVLSKDFYYLSDIYESIALKNNSNDFMKNLTQEDIDNGAIVFDIDPDDFANGKYDYIEDMSSMCF